MELKDAFDIIDATLGMFRSFAGEIDNRRKTPTGRWRIATKAKNHTL